MNSLQTSAGRLPIVLIVDPVVAARFTLWRLLGRRFGVLEAVDACGAREWLACRQDIDALVVQRELPDANGGEFVRSLASIWAPAMDRAVVTGRDDDVRNVVATLAEWFFYPCAGVVGGRRRAVERLAS
jgi:hypothetical protein